MKLLLLIALASLHLGTYAQASKANATDLLNESGWARQMAVFKTTIRSSLIEQIEPMLKQERLSDELKQKSYALLDEDIESTVGEKIINDALRQSLVKELDDSVIDAELKFFRSDFGKRIAEVEAAPASYKSLNEEARSELGGKIWVAASEPRQKLIATISKQLHGADLYIKSSVYAQLGLARGMAIQNAVAIRFFDQAMEKFEGMQKSLIDAYAANDAMDAALVYEPLSDIELEKFLDHILMPSAQKFNEFMVRTLPLILRDRAEALGTKLAMNNKGT